jgi:hypothetical protein
MGPVVVPPSYVFIVYSSYLNIPDCSQGMETFYAVAQWLSGGDTGKMGVQTGRNWHIVDIQLVL